METQVTTSEDTPVMDGDSCTQTATGSLLPAWPVSAHTCQHTCMHIHVYNVHMHTTGCAWQEHTCPHTCAHIHVYNACTHVTSVHGRSTHAHTRACTDMHAHTSVQCAHTHDWVCMPGTVSIGSPPNPGPEGLIQGAPSSQSWKQQVSQEGSASPRGARAARSDRPSFLGTWGGRGTQAYSHDSPPQLQELGETCPGVHMTGEGL